MSMVLALPTALERRLQRQPWSVSSCNQMHVEKEELNYSAMNVQCARVNSKLCRVMWPIRQEHISLFL